MCTSAVPTDCRPGLPSGGARSVGTALGLEAPEPGLELIEVALVLQRRPEPPAGAPRRRLGRRGCAFSGTRRVFGRAEELVEREPAGLLRSRSGRGRGGGGRRCRARAPRAFVPEDLVERETIRR